MTQGKTEAERHPIRVRRWFVLIATPIVVFIVTQLDPVQNAEGWLVEGVTELDLLKLDVLADIIAPVWIFSLIAMAALDRALLERFEGGRGAMPDSALSLSDNAPPAGPYSRTPLPSWPIPPAWR